MEFQIDLTRLRERGLFLGLPMYGGICHGNMAKGLMDLAAMCAANGIPLKTWFLYNESLIPRARNYCADQFLRSECDTFMFIDSDIGFDAKDILAMWHLQIENGYDIFAAPYPKKVIAWEKIATAVEKGHAEKDPNNLENFVGDYVFSVAKAGTIKLDEPLEILEAGTGFMMITRDAFEKFAEFYPQYAYKPDHARSKDFDGSRKIHLYFHSEIDPKTERYLSEDYWFCQKARGAGLKVWLAPWISLSHTGTYTYQGSLPHIAVINESLNVDKKKIKAK